MPTPFIHDDWLLQTKTARELYHEFAAGQPIIDYHNHLSPEQLATNHHFGNLHAAWLDGDHYKWRAMRVNGVDEHLITGTGTDPREKFRAYAATVPQTLRNPLYHWTQLELARYFGVNDLLTAGNADRIYDAATERLQSDDFGTWGLLGRHKVEYICTTDDPTDGLEHHAAAAGNGCPVTLCPGWRPDMALRIDLPGWGAYINRLAEVSGQSISKYEDLLAALMVRMNHFADHGCTISDHSLPNVPNAAYDRAVAGAVCEETLRAEIDHCTSDRAKTFTVTLLTDLARLYAKRNWIFQLHLGALRNNNDRALRELGPDTGFDSIGDYPQAEGLSRLLNHLDDTGELSRTILYNLNPADNAVFATMTGNFASGGGRGKIQWGAAWWFLDQWNGMTEQLNTLSSMGLLSTFVGMLTDSRSFLSFPRHEYFRRLLCNLLAEDMRAGHLPDDKAMVGELVANVCYRNVRSFLAR